MSVNKKVVVTAVISAVVLTSGVLFAVNATKQKAMHADEASAVVREALAPVQELPADPRFAGTEDYDKMAAENANITPNVPSYTVKPDLSNIENVKIFQSLLEPQMIKALAQNYFVVTPTDYIQMFHVYENNEYQRPNKIPSFITTDSMLHTYHVFYDYSLREIETSKLYDAAVKLTDAMLKASKADLAAATNAEVRNAAERNVAYFELARILLGGAVEESNPLVASDLKKINSHQGFDKSTITGVNMDFSQFVPRGHYTRSEKLKKYFKALMWYGLSPLPTPVGKEDITPTLQAILMVRDVRSASSGKTPALKLWDMIYEPTAFYVGTADDYTFYQYGKIVDKVYGKDADINDYAEKGKFQSFLAEVAKLPEPGIDNSAAAGKSVGGRQFRFMGQRFIPDSRIFRQLTHPYVGFRGFPKALDAFAAMGSERALEHMKTVYKADEFEGYNEQMANMRKEMAQTPRARWQSNLYYGWLWSLQSVVEPAPKGYPAFMTSTAWVDKSLWTALGSWTELRHDTILYAKQSVAECGGADEEAEKEPPMPKGYVEPNLEFWTRLKWLNKYTLDGLSSRGLLNEELKDKFEKIDDWLTFCRNISIKELTGKKVTSEEYGQICMYGPELESLIISFAGGDIISDTDKDMALVADVHTDASIDKCLEEATGRVAAIYVVVPIQGKLYITRGSVYTHYEFEWPISDRLTDETWQKMLESGKTPQLADWIKTFYVNTKKKPAQEFLAFSSGC